MNRWEFKLPDIGEGIAEGEIISWADSIEVGARIQEDQPLVEVMTDKATVMITCPKAGAIVELGGKVGQIIPVGANLVVLDIGGEGGQEGISLAENQAAAATAVGDIREELPGVNRLQIPVPLQKKAIDKGDGHYVEKPLATPATRKLARDLGVDIRKVPPTGPNDRVTKEDIRSAAPSAQGHGVSGKARSEQSSFATITSDATALMGTEPDWEERVALRGVRKRIFEQMARSKHTAAHFTFVEECDVTALKVLRSQLRAQVEAHGVKLTYLPFIVKATVAALRKHPDLNSAFDESTQEIVRRRYYHIGIATATESGLMVPVVKHADRKSILQIAHDIHRVSEAAKEGKAKLGDLQGSTFTITSLGQKSGLFATPILNFPEVGILGVHQIKQKPVVREGAIVVGDVMLLSLSFDHRIIDGHVGAAFAYEVIRYLEHPELLFLEMA